MMMSGPSQLRKQLLDGFYAGLRAVDPGEATRSAIKRRTLDPPISVAAIGKAAAPMAMAVVDELGSCVERGIVVSNDSATVSPLLSYYVGDHPFPGNRSLLAGWALQSFVRETPASHTLLFMVSGGASSLVEVPIDGLTVSDIAHVTSTLMADGVPIRELNAVRRHLSAIKDGRLLDQSAARRAVTLLLSDVPGSLPECIGSGPTIRSEESSAVASEILKSHAGIRLDSSRESRTTGRSSNEDAAEHEWEVIADVRTAALAARDVIGGSHFEEAYLQGEAKSEAESMVARTLTGQLRIAAGETTVQVTGDGKGGRNQEAALAASIALEGRPGLFAAMGTDGIDGPTPAAGAIIDGATAGRLRRRGFDPIAALENNDSHRVLSAIGETVVTGHTGTNVGDLWFSWNV